MADRLLAIVTIEITQEYSFHIKYKKKKKNNLISVTYPSLTVLCLCPAVHRTSEDLPLLGVNLKLCKMVVYERKWNHGPVQQFNPQQTIDLPLMLA